MLLKGEVRFETKDSLNLTRLYAGIGKMTSFLVTVG